MPTSFLHKKKDVRKNTFFNINGKKGIPKKKEHMKDGLK